MLSSVNLFNTAVTSHERNAPKPIGGRPGSALSELIVCFKRCPPEKGKKKRDTKKGEATGWVAPWRCPWAVYRTMDVITAVLYRSFVAKQATSAARKGAT